MLGCQRLGDLEGGGTVPALHPRSSRLPSQFHDLLASQAGEAGP